MLYIISLHFLGELGEKMQVDMEKHSKIIIF